MSFFISDLPDVLPVWEYDAFLEQPRKLDNGYYGSMMRHWCGLAFTSEGWNRFNRMKENISYYQGNQKHDDMSYVKVLSGMQPLGSNGGVQNGKMDCSNDWTFHNYNHVWSGIERLTSELNTRGFSFQVKAINKEAQSRRSYIRAKMLAEVAFAPIQERLDKISGIEMAFKGEVMPGVPMPKTVGEIDELMQYGWRDSLALATETAIGFELENMRYLHIRLELFLDLVVLGECSAVAELSNGYPCIRRCSPLQCISDMGNGDGSLNNESSWFVEWDYMPIGDAAARWDIGKKSLAKLQEYWNGNRHGDNLVGGWRGLKINGGQETVYGCFERGGGVDKVLVVRAQWLRLDRVVENDGDGDEYGDEVFVEEQDADDDDLWGSFVGNKDNKLAHEKSNKGKKKPKKSSNGGGSWRMRRHTAVLIGGDLVVEYGEDAHQLARIDALWRSRLGAVCLRPFLRNGVSVGIVDLIKQQQHFLNLIMNKMRFEVSKFAGKAVAIDVSRLPEEWGLNKIENLLPMLKGLGVMVYGSQEMGMPDSGPPVLEMDIGLSGSFGMLMNVASFIIDQMNTITGINKAMLGVMTGQNQGKAVTEMSQMAGSMVVEPYFMWFYLFEGELLDRFANMLKYCANEHPERWQVVLGDFEAALLGSTANDPNSFGLNEYGIFVYPYGVNNRDIREHINAAVAQGSIGIEDALEILNMIDTDGRRAIRVFLKRQALKRQAAAEQQQAMQEAQILASQETAQLRLQQEQIRGEYLVEQAKIGAASLLEQEAMKLDGVDRKVAGTFREVMAKKFGAEFVNDLEK